MNDVESSPLFLATKAKIERAERFLKTIRELEAESQLTNDFLVAELKQLRSDNAQLIDDAEELALNRKRESNKTSTTTG